MKIDLQSKDLIIRVEYKGHRRILGTVYEVPCFTASQQVGAYFQQYGELMEIMPDKKMEEWHFNISLNKNHSMPSLIGLN